VAGKRKGRGKTTTNAKGKVVQVSGPGDEWDLEDYGGGDEGEGDLMDIGVRVGLPVCVTMNLVSQASTLWDCHSRCHLIADTR
jgi:hypothetical protein